MRERKGLEREQNNGKQNYSLIAYQIQSFKLELAFMCPIKPEVMILNGI